MLPGPSKRCPGSFWKPQRRSVAANLVPNRRPRWLKNRPRRFQDASEGRPWGAWGEAGGRKSGGRARARVGAKENVRQPTPSSLSERAKAKPWGKSQSQCQGQRARAETKEMAREAEYQHTPSREAR